MRAVFGYIVHHDITLAPLAGIEPATHGLGNRSKRFIWGYCVR